MNEQNAQHVDQNERTDLLHTDTIATDEGAGSDPAGYEQSINPVGEVPSGESIADRTGRDPANLGDDIPDQGDVVHPAPVNAPVGKTPGM